jgi:hypothetical protein
VKKPSFMCVRLQGGLFVFEPNGPFAPLCHARKSDVAEIIVR